MSRLLIYLFGCVAAFAMANPKVDSLFQPFNKPGVPGASVAVIQNGIVVYSKGYGLAEIDSQTLASAKTNYRLASVSKQFTAMAILILIEEGKLSLDDKIGSVLPELPIYARKITVRQLLGHLGGLRDYEDHIPQGLTEALTDYDVLNIYSGLGSPNFEAGSQYRYSNGGFVLLGLIVERVSQMNFGEFLGAKIFSPLRMNSSVLLQPGVFVSDRAYGYSPSGGGYKKTDQSITSSTRGDGCIYTSVTDYVHWDEALQKNALISPSLQELAFTPGQLNNGSHSNYGFGWMLGTYRGLKRVYHTGSTIGFRTSVERIPEKGLTVVVFANRANSEPWSIAKSILDLYW